MATLLRAGSQLSELAVTCRRCSAVAGIVHDAVYDETFEGLSQRLKRTLDRFTFELQRESVRMGAGELEVPANSEVHINTTNPALLRVWASAELSSALKGYDAFLQCGLHGHARAMMQRQRETLLGLLHDLEQIGGCSLP